MAFETSQTVIKAEWLPLRMERLVTENDTSQTLALSIDIAMVTLAGRRLGSPVVPLGYSSEMVKAFDASTCHSFEVLAKIAPLDRI